MSYIQPPAPNRVAAPVPTPREVAVAAPRTTGGWFMILFGSLATGASPLVLSATGGDPTGFWVLLILGVCLFLGGVALLTRTIRYMPQASGAVEKLAVLAELHASGLLSREEFDRLKAGILTGTPTAQTAPAWGYPALDLPAAQGYSAGQGQPAAQGYTGGPGYPAAQGQGAGDPAGLELEARLREALQGARRGYRRVDFPDGTAYACSWDGLNPTRIASAVPGPPPDRTRVS